MYELAGSEIDAALRSIDLSGDLPRRARWNLERVISQLLSSEQMTRYHGLLQWSCALKTKPVWDAAFPDEDRIFHAAEAAFSETGGDREPSSDLGELQTYLDGKFLLGEDHFPAIYAGFAAWASIRDAAEWHRPRSARAAATELDIPPDEWDSCFYSSLAASGGATWDGDGDTARRRAFWEWYAATAVPLALRAASEVD